MNWDKQTLQDLVVKEATKLKKLATKDELNNLNFYSLNSFSRHYCIYGQVTGSCDSARASQLIFKCCEKVFCLEGADSSADAILNDSPKEERRSYLDYLSPIEVFIDIIGNEGNGNNRALVEFLRDEKKELKFV